MILVTSGALKNVGDYLIHDRGRRVLSHLLPREEFVSVPRGSRLPAELVRSASAVVLCGGPGLAAGFYPDVFPLVPDLDALAVPVLPLALGWSGKPVGAPEDFEFTKSSIDALHTIHERIGWSSTRDDVSHAIMQANGFRNTRRSGCVAWYHLPSLGKAPDLPSIVHHLVVTPPADGKLAPETVKLMRAMRTRYPRAKRYCVFHRGLTWDRHSTLKQSLSGRAMAAAAVALGYKVVDAAFDLSKIDFYGEADLHVGYRVHAHLSFLSQHRPSLLISEDGRGAGQARTLHDPHQLLARDPSVVEKAGEALDVESHGGWPSTVAAIDEIERSWPLMRETILQLQ